MEEEGASGRCGSTPPPHTPCRPRKIQKLGPGSPQQTRGEGPRKLCTQQAYGEALTPPQGPLEVTLGLWTHLPAPRPRPDSTFRRGECVPLSAQARQSRAEAWGSRGTQAAALHPQPSPGSARKGNTFCLSPQEGQEAASSSSPTPLGSGAGADVGVERRRRAAEV